MIDYASDPADKLTPRDSSWRPLAVSQAISRCCGVSTFDGVNLVELE